MNTVFFFFLLVYFDSIVPLQSHSGVTKSFLQLSSSGDEDLTAAQAEKRRAMDAASELTGANKRIGESKDGVDMDINLPGGAKLGAGGVKEKTNGIVVRKRNEHGDLCWSLLHLRRTLNGCT